MSKLSDELLSERELAEELDKSERTVKRWRAQRVGPPFLKLGNRIYYRRESARQWLIHQEQHQPRAGGAHG